MHRTRSLVPWASAVLLSATSCATTPKPPEAAPAAPPKVAAGQPAPAAAPASGDEKKKPEWKVTEPPGEWGWHDVAIDTAEGSWMSLDVAPDGSAIVFDLLGDLYEVPMTGGDAKALRSGLAWHQQPRYSPDGRKIAFTSDEGAGDNLWVMNRDGSDAAAVSKESFRLVNNPAWEPSGQYLVGKKHFTSKRSLGAGEMWLYHVTGGEGVQMTARPNEQKDVNDPAFSPDGRYLYFDRDATPGRFFEYNKDSSKQIYVIERLDRETGEVTQVTGGPGGAARPTPSPDGKHLAFVRRVDYATTLFVRDLETGAERPLFGGMERDNQEVWALHGVYPGMAWTPDSKAIVFWAKGGLHKIDVATAAVSAIPFRVKTTKKVAKVVRSSRPVAPERFDVKMLRSVAVSPAGDMVAYVALGHVWVRPLPEGQPRRLTQDEARFEHDPAFSRDGKSVVFATWSDRDLGDLRIAPVAGGKARVITRTPGHFIRPKFSPDGAWVVFEKVAGGYLRDARYSDEPGIYRVASAGGPAERVAQNGVEPHFGARGDRLYFMRSKGEETKDTRTLVAYDLVKKTERELYTSESAQALLVSPDGRWLAFRDGFNVYVTPLVETGRTVSLAPEGKGLPVAKVTKEAGASLSWAGDSRALYWNLGPELFTRPLTDAFAFLDGAPKELPEPPATGMQVGFQAQTDVPSGVIALTGARVITMKGDEVIENGTVLITGNRITAVGPAGKVSIPKGAKVVDVAGKTIIPGLIDAHAHGAQGTDGIIPQHNWGQYANLAFGVTTIHDPSNDTEEVFSASELQKAGMIRAPRIFSTGTILYGAAGADYKSKVESLDDALFHLKRMKAVGAFSVKSYNQPRRDQRQMVLEAARQLDMLVVPEGGATYMHNMTMVVDGHTTVEHNIPLETLYDDVMQLWSASEVASTPTLVVAYGGISGEFYWYQHTDVWRNAHLTRFVPHYVVDPRSRRRQKAPEGDYNHVAIAKNLKKLVDHGRLVNTGAHGQMAGLGEHWELWMFVQGGMTPHEALRAATMSPATTLGMAADLGSLEAGKLADLVVLDANPLDDIRKSEQVRMVMVNGRLFDAATLDQLGNHPDTEGSAAFGDGPNSLGIGRWWGSAGAEAASHAGCVCETGL
ncbi:MAG: PD40 domain-containing protein [Deltaproteobacteria bacterium]|nr:PD40 domain-containing protein [Deltaproteobacteria bacterium]